MQLRIDRSGLARELALVTLAARPCAGTQSGSLVRLEARADGVLRLAVNNLEYSLASQVEARVLGAGAICLPAKPFLALVQALEGEITISTDANQYAIITAERSRSRMPGEAADQFSELEPMPVTSTEIPAEILSRLLPRVSFAAGICGLVNVAAVFVRFTDDAFQLVATDGHRLALAQATIDSRASTPVEFLFPLSALDRVTKLVEGQKSARLSATDHHIFLTAGTRSLVTRRVAGSLPDHSRYLQEPTARFVTVDSDELRSAMTRVFLFTESGARLDPKMRFVLRRGELLVSSVSVHTGESENSVPCDYQDPEIAVGFNPRYVRDFLNVVPIGKLRVWIKDPKTAAEWRLEGDDSYRYFVAPQSLKE